MPGSSTASSSPTGSGTPPRVRAGRMGERPEAHGSASYSGFEGSSRPQAFPIRPGSERKRRLTSTGEDTRQWSHAGSVSMVMPSSRTRSSISASAGSSYATAIDLSSSPPEIPRSFASEQLPRRYRRESYNWAAQAMSGPNNPNQAFIDMSLPTWQADSDVTECPICETVFSFWQFIVRPPDSEPFESSPVPSQPPVVDLTDDEPATPSSTINPALGGGEEVRLCNPCVPDPNPNPLGFGNVRGSGHRSTHSLSSTMPGIFQNLSRDNHIHDARQERRTVGSSDRPQYLEQLTQSRQPFPGTRQYRSFSNRDAGLPRRPALDEADFCPVCRRQFPPLGPDHPIEARQAHTRDCIEGYLRPTAASRDSPEQGPPLPPPPPEARMLKFVATEKDCLGGDGQPAECTICMEDYEVGQTLARLECLCKFHRHCIVDWFDRKEECPVHKVS
ncbi:hypothetical protein PENANT_c018G11083 [Penicillium antarcticum]|uniref:RING-type E3 ubiquitin transferase n=1 Tax=Penicillium antarcticum TaxID=416450 RepID=A0A1V6Q1D0_9EURO|nr:hypothetical protein PENANT_c018G11083 [Penicillium antarcticum]